MFLNPSIGAPAAPSSIHLDEPDTVTVIAARMRALAETRQRELRERAASLERAVIAAPQGSLERWRACADLAAILAGIEHWSERRAFWAAQLARQEASP